jgi:two-component system alkaline phosphatase synthesis response regulator PhoP
MLPQTDGLTVLKKLRASARYGGVPVIMLTAKGGEFDKVKGLDAGADDYVVKPFGVTELISRINAVLRRGHAPPPAGAGEKSVHKGLTLDDSRHEVLFFGSAFEAGSAGGERVELTFKEYELLRYFMRNAGLALSRDRIMQAVWGYDFEGETRTVDAHVKSLRRKLGGAGEYIKTVRGVGYKLD